MSCESIVLEYLLEAASKNKSGPALSLSDESLSYGELFGYAKQIGDQLAESETTDITRQPVTAIVADKTWVSYAGILACLMRGHTFVPLNPKFPSQRNLEILKRSKASRIICNDDLRSSFTEVIDSASLSEKASIHSVFVADDLVVEAARPDFFASTCADMFNGHDCNEPEDIIYILFTSGSTGNPKGVPIKHSNLAHYVKIAGELLGATNEDRFSQTFDLTFDLSMHDMFLCWSSGAHLVVPSREDLVNPAKYINTRSITQWFSVPSLAYQMRLKGDLKPGAFPQLRTSLFCGEALPSLLAQEWMAAAPNSRVENWYGPTEATIACTRFEILKNNNGADIDDSTLAPIGTAFSGMEAIVCGPDLIELEDGKSGELFLGGEQIAPGYLNDPEKTSKAFMPLPDRNGLYYRTGDGAVKSGGELLFLGRLDNQVKVRGFRIELGEIEAALRSAAGGNNCAAFSWPPDNASGRFVIAAIEGDEQNADGILDELRSSLPNYMVPTDLVFLNSFPTNSSGKADRKEIADLIHETLRARNSKRPSSQNPDETRFLNCILKASPALSIERIHEAENLIDAGMDSLAFINLTVQIEKIYKVDLDQEQVVALSMMPFQNIVRFLKGQSVLDSMNTGLQSRANRVIQFIEAFPELLKQGGPEFCFAIGSSGTMSAFSPGAFDQTAKDTGVKIRSVNIGLVAVRVDGISRICQYIRECCEQAKLRPAAVIYELDPMHICALPPKGDISIDESMFGRTAPKPSQIVHAEFQWSAETRGTFEREEVKKRKRLPLVPGWTKKRDRETINTFSGKVDFNETAIQAWIRGANELQQLCDRVVGFIHPLKPNQYPAPEDKEKNKYLKMLKRISEETGISFYSEDQFSLEEDDFININHMTPQKGKQTISRQLAELCIKDNLLG
ncbi:MAG: non-ribosomal peptide synthetase [Verrucomicrobiales bacterium]|nr:non-ribosomal peptide synthetase [Verrucomicrobiales bacterium]